MAHPASASEQHDIDADVSRMIGVIEDLIAVIGEENRALAAGLPASLSGAMSLKAALSMKLESWAGGVHGQPLMLAAATPQLRDSLVQRSSTLSAAMEENITRIKAALNATGSRVNAIMGAIREQAETEIAYHANGSVGSILRRPAVNAGRMA